MAQPLVRNTLPLWRSSSSPRSAVLPTSYIARLASPGPARAGRPLSSLAQRPALHSRQPLRPSSEASTLLVSRSSRPDWLARFQHAASTPSKPSAPAPASTASASAKPDPAAEAADPDAPPPNSGFRDRMRFLTRRYGWWALAVYLLASVVDFSLCFAAIHLLGAEHIKGLERSVRKWIGMAEREEEDEEAVGAANDHAKQGTDEERGLGVANNESARQKALLRVHGSTAAIVDADRAVDEAPPLPAGAVDKEVKPRTSSSGAWISTALWTEIVLAYTIHKTLLLPFRVFVTAGITPSFVKLMVRWGWSRPNAVVQKATQEAAKRRAAKKAAAAAAS